MPGAQAPARAAVATGLVPAWAQDDPGDAQSNRVGASRSTCRHASESRPSPQRWPQPALVAGEGRRDVAVRAGRSAQQGRAVPPIRMAVKSGPCLRPGEAPQTRNAPGGGGRAHGRLSSSSKK